MTDKDENAPDAAEQNENEDAGDQKSNSKSQGGDKKDDKEKKEKGGVAMPKVPSPFDESEHVDTIVSERDAYNLSPCCCCLCACSHDRVGDATCFGCLPIRCGILFIAIQIFLLAIVLITVTFFGLLNEYLPWWYVFITLLLLIPLAIAASTMVYFFARDNRSTRGNLFGGIIMSIIAISLWCTW
jgi:hypothetical protein